MSEFNLEALKLLEEKKRLQDLLPHRYAFRDYRWAVEFMKSRNRICLLTAANQVGKSSIQIRKMITWATEPSLWPSLWASRPTQFWYLYPSKDVVSLEYSTKWVYLLPQGELKEHPQYGWKVIMDNKRVVGIQFNTGIFLAFKTYGQDVQTLQSGTVFYLGADEETPSELVPELLMRLSASNGYFSAVFTPTRGEELWRLAMEERGTKHETFKTADKWQISLYDCLTYADGSKSSWTLERIREIESRCGTESQVQVRVHGRFILIEGRTFESFSIKDNVRPGGKIPSDWLIYSGIDYGSGGESGHPAAITFVAVRPDFTRGRVVRAWRGDGIMTEATDIILKHVEMKKELLDLGLNFVSARYDHAARDLFTIATRMSEPIEAAEKAHSVGIPILNSLFKNQMLDLDEDQPEVMKLAYELSSLRVSQSKTAARDNLCDSTRYASALIPWNWSGLNSKDGKPDTYKEIPKEKTEIDWRRESFMQQPEEPHDIEKEFEEWNTAYEG